MLRLAGARLLDDRDGRPVREVLAADPVAACMVAARVEVAGLDPWRLGGELWGTGPRREHRLDGLCYAGPNMVPLLGGRGALRAFADRAADRGRSCSSMVGPAEQVMGMWGLLRSAWGPAREERPDQPLLVCTRPPAVAPDPLVRQVRPEELDRYLPAAVAMFQEEVGVDPRVPDGGAGYRGRVGELISSGRAFARFEGDEVVYKAEIGAMSAAVGQIQGVWVAPHRRGQGLAAAGTAAVVEQVQRRDRIPSLYVNGFNEPARATYRRVGFTRCGSFATILF